MPSALVAAAAPGLSAVTFILPRTRKRIEDAIDQLIAVLDAIDGDPDCEADNDAEPTATEEHGRGFRATDFADDEEDGCDAEGNDPDLEHTIGWSEAESLSGAAARGGTDRDRQEEFA